MNETTSELKLSEKDEKILNTPVALYEYVKSMYGDSSTEKPGADPSIIKTIKIMLPAFQNIEKPTGSTMSWSMHLENNTSKENLYLNSKDLVFLVQWPDESTASSRVIALESVVHHHSVPKDSKPYAQCRYHIVANSLFEKDDLALFSTVTEIMKKMNHFLKEY